MLKDFSQEEPVSGSQEKTDVPSSKPHWVGRRVNNVRYAAGVTMAYASLPAVLAMEVALLITHRKHEKQAEEIRHSVHDAIGNAVGWVIGDQLWK